MPYASSLVVDHDIVEFSTIFTLEYEEDTSIGALIKLVAEILAYDPDKGQPNDAVQDFYWVGMDVYHCPDLPLSSKNALKSAISTLDLSKGGLPGTELVKDIVLPILFTRAVTQKRPSSPLNHAPALKKLKLLEVSPSLAGANYWSLQQTDEDRLLDDRPQEDADVPPIQLLYQPFGLFEHVFSGCDLPLGDMEIDWPTLQSEVDQLTAAMSLQYDDEEARSQDFLRRLRAIFNDDFQAASIGSSQTDGHSTVHGLVDTIMEIKNQSSGTDAVPYAQAAAFVGQSHKNSPEIERLCNQYRLPALCITFVRFQIQFFGILLLGHRYRVVSLSPGLSCSPAATNGRDRQQLYSAFAAAILLRKHIRKDLRSYVVSPLPDTSDSPASFYFPAVSSILDHAHPTKDSEKRYINFRLSEPYGPVAPSRQLYKARLVGSGGGGSDGQEILVKFTRQYCIKLHDFCAALGHAPKVLGYEVLPGGWHAIAMEFLPDACSIRHHPAFRAGEKDMVLWDLVERFHAKGLVHGDLRYTNIICDEAGDRIWLVDFDWGGEAGKVKYPSWLLHEALCIGRRWDLIIRKEDDLRILGATLAGLDPR